MGAEGLLARKVDGTLADLADVDDGAQRTIGGVVTNLQRKWTKKGDLMAVFTLEDLQSAVEVMVFPKTMADMGHLLADDVIVVVAGRVDKREDQPKFIARDISVFEPVIDLRPPLRLQVSPRRLSDDIVERLKDLLSEFPGDSEVFIHLGERTILRLPDHFTVDTTGGLMGELRVLLGAESIVA